MRIKVDYNHLLDEIFLRTWSTMRAGRCLKHTGKTGAAGDGDFTSA